MRKVDFLIAAIWVIFIVGGFLEGMRIKDVPFRALPLPILALPFIFFCAAAFFQRHPSDGGTMRRITDWIFGSGTYSRLVDFLQRLRFVALMMVHFLAGGIAGLLLTTYISTKNSDAYFASAFVFSGGLGLLAAYLLSLRFPPRLY